MIHRRCKIEHYVNRWFCYARPNAQRIYGIELQPWEKMKDELIKILTYQHTHKHSRNVVFLRNGQIIGCRGSQWNRMAQRCCASLLRKFGFLTLSSSISKHERFNSTNNKSSAPREERRSHLAPFLHFYSLGLCQDGFLMNKGIGMFSFLSQKIIMLFESLTC